MSVFSALIGQPDVATDLERAATGEGMTSSWLFVGAAGSGRSVAARAFAAALQCTAPAESLDDSTPHGCGECTACTTVLAETHADLTVLRPEGLSIGVDEARSLVLGSAMRPTTGRWRILIIEDADRLTESAANALLKALEEPAERTVFLLCAPAVDDVLPTIRSRCRLVRLRPPSSAAVADVLTREGVDRSIAVFAARAAQGHVGRARRLATDEQARTRRAEVLRLPTRLSSVADCLAAAADLVEAAEEEAEGLNADRAAAETAELQSTLSGSKGAGGRGTGSRGTGSRGSMQVRGAAGALKDLEKRQKSRGRRAVLDAIDRALVDLAAWYRDVLAEQLGVHVQTDIEWVHDDQRREIAAEATNSCAEQTLRRLEAVLACRAALEETPGMSAQLAIESLALQLRSA